MDNATQATENYKALADFALPNIIELLDKINECLSDKNNKIKFLSNHSRWLEEQFKPLEFKCYVKLSQKQNILQLESFDEDVPVVPVKWLRYRKLLNHLYLKFK